MGDIKIIMVQSSVFKPMIVGGFFQDITYILITLFYQRETFKNKLHPTLLKVVERLKNEERKNERINNDIVRNPVYGIVQFSIIYICSLCNVLI